MSANVDAAVVEGFGDEWSRFDQSSLGGEEYDRLFASYFHIFPWHELPANAEGFDLGCGSGRWARGVAPRVGTLHCIDASDAALAVARRNLAGTSNVRFHHADAGRLPLGPSTMDFGYCLGVLHHVPDTSAGLAAAVAALKPGAPFLLYLYYAFDNRPAWYRGIWRAGEALRFVVSRSPLPLRYAMSQAAAFALYWPLARMARALERAGRDVSSLPLAAYRDCSLYTMRTDALDRLGTRLEKRFTRAEMRAMMERAGLRDIVFSDGVPFWCAVGRRA
jgi:SAM-dependent methyltransferase